MADRVSVADGNFTSSSVWADLGHTLISTNTGVTALTTGNHDSQTFIPAASAIIGICLRLGVRAAGTPTNQLTVHLRNSTTGTDVKTVVVNVSDLPESASGADSEGGWFFLLFDSSHTPNGTDSYLIRATLDSTSTAVSLSTNGTSNNWQRMVVLSTTAAPAAGDDLHVMGVFDGSSSPATTGTRTVTMDQTSATDYGSLNTNSYVAALDISNRGTLTYGTTASTNYVLRVSGWIVIFSGGTLNIGTTGTAIPRTSTAVLELDPSANNQLGIRALNGSTWTGQGLSRTSGKDVSWTLLTADLAASGTSSTVADDTGWLNGDEVALAATSRTSTEGEIVTLSADAGASSFSHSAASNAHLGNTAHKYQAEALLLTRNVIVRSTGSTNQIRFDIIGSASVDMDWVRFRYCGPTATVAINVLTTIGSATFNHCVAMNSTATAFRIAGDVTTGTVSFINCGVWIFGSNNASYGFGDVRTAESISSGSITMDGCVVIANNSQGVNTACFNFDRFFTKMTLNNLHAVGGGAGIEMDRGATFGIIRHDTPTFTNVYLHANGNGLETGGSYLIGLRFGGDLYIWRNTTQGWQNRAAIQIGCRYEGTTVLAGNPTAISLSTAGIFDGWYIANLRCNGDTTFSQGASFSFLSGECVNLGLRIDRYTSQATGLWIAPTAFMTGGSNGIMQGILVNILTAESSDVLSIHDPPWSPGGYFGMQSRDGDLTTTIVNATTGTLSYETSTVDVSPAMKMVPDHVTQKLDTAAGVRGRGFLVGVASGEQPTISVKVRKNAGYDGNAPRLVLKANASIGINADVVLDTLSVGADTWEVLTGQIPSAATANGVVECVVDCDGTTAGAVFVDTWSATGAGAVDTGGLKTWMDGFPVITGGAIGGVFQPHRLMGGGMVG